MGGGRNTHRECVESTNGENRHGVSNMPRRRVRSIGTVAVVAAVCALGCPSSFAGEPPAQVGGSTVTPQGNPAPSGASASTDASPPTVEAKNRGKSGATSGPGAPRRFGAKLTARESRQIRHLGEQVEAKTTLTPEEKAMVRRRLDHYASRMEAGMIEGSDVYDGPGESREDVEATFGPLPSAVVDPKPGVRPRGVKSKPPASPLGAHTYILNDIASSLNADARKQFNEVGLRWQKLKYRGGPDGPLTRLMRALRDPLLQLTEEKAEHLRTTVGGIMASAKASRKDADVMAAVVKEAREKVDAELSPEQIKQLDATLAEMAKEQDAEEANAKRLAQVWEDEAKDPPPTARQNKRADTAPKPASDTPAPKP